jgi:hypothetical protein
VTLRGISTVPDVIGNVGVTYDAIKGCGHYSSTGMKEKLLEIINIHSMH